MNTDLLARTVMTACESKGQHYKKMSFALPLLMFTTLLESAVLIGIVVIEFGLMHEVMSYLKAALPGEEQRISINLLSLSGCIMLAAFHMKSKEQPGMLAVRFIARATPVIVVIFAMGLGVMFAATLWFDGADGLFGASGSTTQMFSNHAAPASGSWVNKLFSSLGLIFVFGTGGLALVTLYASQRLLTVVSANFSTIAQQVFAICESRRSIKKIHATNQKYSELAHERTALENVMEKEIQVNVANRILAARHKVIAPIEALMTKHSLQGECEEFTIPALTLDPKEIAARLKIERALTLKTIIAAMNGETK